MELTCLGIPIYALVAAGAAILAVISFAIYIFLLKRRVAVYSKEFDVAIDEFNAGCNPGHPMSDEEWSLYRSSHDDDFEHSHKVASSKLIALFVRDISNANTLVDIDDNHQAYLDDARVKNGYITTFEQAIEEAIEAKRATFDSLHYIAHSESLELEQKAKKATDAANLCIENNLLDYLTHAAECTELHEAIASLEDNRTSHNADFVKSELANCSDFFDHVLAYPLDPQQRDAIVNGEDNCLVVSSAGSGKTSTINGKVRYLVDVRGVKPDDILLITYTRKAAEELRTRIGYKSLRCVTFHKLAYEIISQVEARPTICDDSFKLKVFYKMLKNQDFLDAVTFYMMNYLSRMKNPDEYETREEYLADRRRYGNKAFFPDMDGNPILTKSEEERKICHYLFTHNVRFRYEERYEVKTSTPNHRQYQPDFSIYYMVGDEEHRLYLEHFGVNKQGNVPKWFADGQSINWETANKNYNSGIIWKRHTHARFGTNLIETRSSMFYDGTWQTVLKENLTRYGVELKEKTSEEIYEALIKRDKHKEETILQLIGSFISLMKANCKDVETLISEAEQQGDERNLYILQNIIKPYFEAYEDALQNKGEIDFTDAILNATDFCNEGRYGKKYRYIIIDEFQDISFDRYKLLLSIRHHSPLGKIFAVGDDWQSIYRFSGSDMGLFSEFPKYFGFTTQCKIESTYRFAQPTIDISSAFIQKNESQVKKNVKSPKENATTTINFKGYNGDQDLAESVYQQILQTPNDQTITIISRYSFDFAVFKDPEGLNTGKREKFSYHETDNSIDITVGGRKIRCLTVHQAKGLEADIVILLKCNSDIYGFPSLISDDPVLEYVLSQHEDSIDFAEERRLFYVAITRAKTNTTIYYLKYNPSVFILEITNETEDDVFKKCPFCGYGHLRIAKEGWTTTGDYYVSVGCSNFALASCDYYQTYFYKQEPTKEQVERLVLANPNNPDNQVTVDRPLTPQRPPAPNPTTQAAPAPPQPQQPRPRVGYVDTNSIQSSTNHLDIKLPSLSDLPNSNKQSSFKDLNPDFFPDTVMSRNNAEYAYDTVVKLINEEIFEVMKIVRPFTISSAISKQDRKVLSQINEQFTVWWQDFSETYNYSDDFIKKTFKKLDDFEAKFKSFGIRIPAFKRPVFYR